MAEQKKVSGSGSGDPKKDAERTKWEREKQVMTDRHQRDKEAFAKKKELASKSKKDKKESTFEFDPVKEASTKANKLHIMHAAKLISKMKSGHEKENAITDLEKKAKNLGLDRAEYEKILDKHIPEFPEEIKLKLPKLKKVGGKTELPKIKLPKLKKV